MLSNILNVSKRLPRPDTNLNLIRAFCQNLDNDIGNTVKSIENHESKLLAELNRLEQWESCKYD